MLQFWAKNWFNMGLHQEMCFILLSGHCRGSTMFQCVEGSKRCYTIHERCNGIGSCTNKKDEENCSEFILYFHVIFLFWFKSNFNKSPLAHLIINGTREGGSGLVFWHVCSLKVALGRHSQQTGNKFSTTNCRSVASLPQHRPERLVVEIRNTLATSATCRGSWDKFNSGNML